MRKLKSIVLVFVALTSAALFTGCQLMETSQPPAPPTAPVAAAPAPSVAPPAPAPAPAPIRVLPFDEAVAAAANALFSNATEQTKEQRVVLVDPLIDAVTGMESAQTRLMEKRIVELVKDKYPRFSVQAFTAANLAKSPIVLVGTFTPIDSKNQVRTTREQYRICLALADMSSEKILAKGVARSQLDGIDSTPTPFHRDAVVWSGDDPATMSYVRTCQATRPGDPIDAVYRQRIYTAAVVNEAIKALEARNFVAANELFRSAAQSPPGNQLRVLNGWLMSSLSLNRQREAAEAAARIAEYGLERRDISMKFLFKPGRSEFVQDPAVAGRYPLLLREIGRKTAASDVCLELVGHASRSGPEPLNERLSLARAEYVRSQLDRQSRVLAKRTSARGVGSREWIVGTGTDDVRDAVDRRVQIKVSECKKA